jgi:hypothetical protein
MSTSAIRETSPRSIARLAGVFQLLEAITATFGQVVVLGALFVAGNAAATATNILGRQELLWWGFASSLIGIVFHLAWALLLYDLLKVVDRRLAKLGLLVMVVGCAVSVVATVLYVAPMTVLGANSSSAFSTEQSQLLALTFLRLNEYAYGIYLVFFGLWCFLTGVLIFRSTFLPRAVGVLLAISGLGWMVYLSPSLARHLFMPYIAGASALGEIPLLLWCLVFGVNGDRQDQCLS